VVLARKMMSAATLDRALEPLTTLQFHLLNNDVTGLRAEIAISPGNPGELPFRAVHLSAR
jgi:hypothetical protein